MATGPGDSSSEEYVSADEGTEDGFMAGSR